MKKFIWLILLTLPLTACSSGEGAEGLYKREQPIAITITTPESASDGKITATLTQNDQPVLDPDYVHFEIWKQDGTVAYEMEEATAEGDGVFSLSKPFPSEGLYYVKVHASSHGSYIMPTKQFIIGSLTASDVEFLETRGQVEQGAHEGHH